MPIGAAVQKTEHPVGRDRHKGGLPSRGPAFFIWGCSALFRAAELVQLQRAEDDNADNGENTHDTHEWAYCRPDKL